MSELKSAGYFSYSEVVVPPVTPFPNESVPGGPLEIDEKILELTRKDFLFLLASLEQNKTA